MMEISWRKEIRCKGYELGESDTEAFITGYMAGSDVKFWLSVSLIGVSFGVGVIVGALI